MGQLRFALRQDLDPASFGTCEIEELRRHEPHGFDVLLLAKKFMADASPFRVICLVPAEVCVRMRASFIQPSGVADRRAISEKLRKNLLKKAPACRKQGSISTDAESYLIGWAQGTWPRVARPTKYNFLELRRFDIPNVGRPETVPWQAPDRFRVYNILRSDDDSDDGCDDDGPVDLLFGGDG